MKGNLVEAKELSTTVVVIGAGLAGLSAARALRTKGVNVVVVEARDRVGGRTLNLPIAEGKVVEVGGQWVGPGQERILSLIDELGLETFDTYGAGKNLFEHGARLSSYQGAIPKVNPVALADVQLAMTRLERMAPNRATRIAVDGVEVDTVGCRDGGVVDETQHGDSTGPITHRSGL